MRLIDALELKRSISASVLCEDGKHIFDIIDEQPTIEPERKRGRWVTHKELHKNMCYYIKCSKCGKEAIWTNGFSLYPPNFCPNCGADMKEGDVDG